MQFDQHVPVARQKRPLPAVAHQQRELLRGQGGQRIGERIARLLQHELRCGDPGGRDKNVDVQAVLERKIAIGERGHRRALEEDDRDVGFIKPTLKTHGLPGKGEISARQGRGSRAQIFGDLRGRLNPGPRNAVLRQAPDEMALDDPERARPVAVGLRRGADRL